jgi:hypothetical protein
MPSRKGKPNRLQNKHTLIDIYSAYSKEVQKKSKYDLTYKEFLKIATTLLNNCTDHIINDSGEVRLNHGLGIIRIKKIRTNYNKPKIDWKKTEEVGKKVYHLNMHSNGYYIRWYWAKLAKAKVAGKIPYCFTPHRINTKRASKLFGSGQQDYFE